MKTISCQINRKQNYKIVKHKSIIPWSPWRALTPEENLCNFDIFRIALDFKLILNPKATIYFLFTALVSQFFFLSKLKSYLLNSAYVSRHYWVSNGEPALFGFIEHWTQKISLQLKIYYVLSFIIAKHC